VREKGGMCGRWANLLLGILQPNTKLCNFDEVRALFVHLTTKNHPYPKKESKPKEREKENKP
jgi:hypothetical protein